MKQICSNEVQANTNELFSDVERKTACRLATRGKLQMVTIALFGIYARRAAKSWQLSRAIVPTQMSRHAPRVVESLICTLSGTRINTAGKAVHWSCHRRRHSSLPCNASARVATVSVSD